jgi:NADH dehydrogenase [ubiquinone] 1 alpha subcomplex assembly factor 1
MNLSYPNPFMDMADPALLSLWRVVNDGVMGGLSESSIRLTDQESALFSGTVSLRNNGGFASMQARFHPLDLSGFEGVDVLLCGDGKRYGLWLREPNQRLVHQYEFTTKQGVWQTVRIPFAVLQPKFFGTWVNAAPIDLTQVSSMAFIIDNKQEGPFALEIGHLSLYPVTV